MEYRVLYTRSDPVVACGQFWSETKEVEVEGRAEKTFYATRNKVVDAKIATCVGGEENLKSRPWLVESVRTLCNMYAPLTPIAHLVVVVVVVGFFAPDANSLGFVYLSSVSRLRCSGRSYLGP